MEEATSRLATFLFRLLDLINGWLCDCRRNTVNIDVSQIFKYSFDGILWPEIHTIWNMGVVRIWAWFPMWYNFKIAIKRNAINTFIFEYRGLKCISHLFQDEKAEFKMFTCNLGVVMAGRGSQNLTISRPWLNEIPSAGLYSSIDVTKAYCNSLSVKSLIFGFLCV